MLQLSRGVAAAESLRPPPHSHVPADASIEPRRRRRGILCVHPFDVELAYTASIEPRRRRRGIQPVDVLVLIRSSRLQLSRGVAAAESPAQWRRMQVRIT